MLNCYSPFQCADTRGISALFRGDIEEEEEEEDEDEEEFASEREIVGASTCEDIHRRVRAARDLSISAITFLDVEGETRIIPRMIADDSMLEARCAKSYRNVATKNIEGYDNRFTCVCTGRSKIGRCYQEIDLSRSISEYIDVLDSDPLDSDPVRGSTPFRDPHYRVLHHIVAKPFTSFLPLSHHI